eukprot:4443411-Alexandrium_andersonii.AAC.1
MDVHGGAGLSTPSGCGCATVVDSGSSASGCLNHLGHRQNESEYAMARVPNWGRAARLRGVG